MFPNRLIRVATVLLTSVAIVVSAFATPPATPGSPSRRRTQTNHLPADVMKGGKLDLDELVRLLVSSRKGYLKQSRIFEAIQSRGIAFSANAESSGRLLDVGASPGMLQLVQALSLPQLPKPPLPIPLQPSYALALSCDPSDCEVRVGDSAFQKISGTKALFTGLSIGRYIVDAKLIGFEPKTEIVDLNLATLGGERTLPYTVVLRPTEETRREWGTVLLASIMSSAGSGIDRWSLAGKLTVSDVEPAIFGPEPLAAR